MPYPTGALNMPWMSNPATPYNMPAGIGTQQQGCPNAVGWQPGMAPVQMPYAAPPQAAYDNACQGRPQRSAEDNFGPGDQVEIWSNSIARWCRGTVERVEGGFVHVAFVAPDGKARSKGVPLGHEQIRKVAGATGVFNPHETFVIDTPGACPSQASRSRPPDGGSFIPQKQMAQIQRQQQQQQMGQPQAPQLHTVVVDSQEDIVDPRTGKKRVAKVSKGALHGGHLESVFSMDEHGQEVAHPGAKFKGNKSASRLANTVVQQGMHLAYGVDQEHTDILDSQWRVGGGQDLLAALFSGIARDQRELGGAIEQLAGETQKVLASQPSLVEATVPAKVYGDLHGQFRDMLLHLFHWGFPEANGGPTLIFNGDWADRGKHQLEVVCLVFALKVVFPQSVWLVRGNHEDDFQNQAMDHTGFGAHCCQRLGDSIGGRIFTAIHKAFQWLPLGCVLGRKILIVHGGIGDGRWELSHIARAQRPLSHEALTQDPILYNVLWSDPIPDDPSPQDTFGVHDSPRDHHQHMILTFGSDVTAAFCARNRIEAVIRSHQAIARGYGYDVMHDGRCIRVFSARDYEGYGNDGCVLMVLEGNPRQHGGPHLLIRPQVVRSLAMPKPDD